MKTVVKISLALGAAILVAGAFLLDTRFSSVPAEKQTDQVVSQNNSSPQRTEAPTVAKQTEVPATAQPAQPVEPTSAKSRPLAPNPTPAPIPKASSSKRLAFALLSLSNPQNRGQVGVLLSNASIDGVAVQIGWTSMETADGVFDWTTLDAVLKTAKEQDKGVTLHIFSGGPLGIAAWLKTAGIKTYTFTDPKGRTHEEAVPWDQTLLSKYSQFLRVLAAHLSSGGYANTVARMSVAVPVAEMDLVACRNNTLANAYPYDRATYVSSWETMIDVYASAFPALKKFISAPVGLICFPDRDAQFFTEVMNYASQKYGKTFIPFAADLTAEGSDRTKPYISTITALGVGYQPIWSSTNDPSDRMKSPYPGSLLAATCKAVSNGADYVEIYAVDVLNTDQTIQKGIQAVHDTGLCKL